jgi:Novel STAND NTPase 1
MPVSEDVPEEPSKAVSPRPFEIPAITPPKEPFRGIEPFRYCDQFIFSERRDQAARLQKMVFVYRGTLLAGGSGVGKSSLVNAGFLPRILQDRFLPERVRVRPKRGAEFEAERIPLGEADQPPYLPSRFISTSLDEGSLAISADQLTGIVSKSHPAGDPLLVFDQFEELITLFDETPDSPEKYEEAQIAQALIVRTLARLLQDAILRVKFLFVFRDDYYLKLGKFFDRVPGLREQGMYLEPLPTTRLKQLIREPFVLAAAAGKTFERPIEDALANELARAIIAYSDSPYINLTEVQIICQNLWRDPNGAENFIAAADKVQQIKTLLERYVDERITWVSDHLREPAIGILIRLITASDTRNIVAEPDLLKRLEKEDGVAREVSTKALNELVSKSRLVNRQKRGNTAFYEIVSEFLIPWIRRRRDVLRDKLREEQQRKKRRSRRVFRSALEFARKIKLSAYMQ